MGWGEGARGEGGALGVRVSSRRRRSQLNFVVVGRSTSSPSFNPPNVHSRYGPSDFFSCGMLQKHKMVVSLAQAHIEVKRVEQIKSVVVLTFLVDYFVAVVPFFDGASAPLAFRWSRWLRPVYMILTSREVRWDSGGVG